jgi:hypothetical protein
MAQFVEGYIFKYVLLPALGGFVAFLVRLQTHDGPPRREDHAFGFELFASAIVTFFALACERALDWARTDRSLNALVAPVERAALEAHRATLEKQVLWAFSAMFLIFVGLIVLTYIVRTWGWKTVRQAGAEPVEELTTLVGIALPDVAGLVVLATVTMYFSG